MYFFLDSWISQLQYGTFQRNQNLFKCLCVQLTQHVDTKKLNPKINRTYVLHISTQNGVCILLVCYLTILSASRLYSVGNRTGAGMRSYMRNQSTQKLPATEPFCPPWISHDLNCNQTWASCCMYYGSLCTGPYICKLNHENIIIIIIKFQGWA